MSITCTCVLEGTPAGYKTAMQTRGMQMVVNEESLNIIMAQQETAQQVMDRRVRSQTCFSKPFLTPNPNLRNWTHQRPRLVTSLGCCITTACTCLQHRENYLSLSIYLLHRQHHWIQDSISTPERSLCGTPLYRKVWPRSCSWKTYTNFEVITYTHSAAEGHPGCFSWLAWGYGLNNHGLLLA